MLEKTPESPLDCKEIQAAHPKGNQSWIFIGRTDAEALILWPPDAKNWLIGKDSDAGKDWRQNEKEMTGWDGWMASLTRWMFVWTALGVSNGQGSLACCSPWDRNESDTTEWLNNNMIQKSEMICQRPCVERPGYKPRLTWQEVTDSVRLVEYPDGFPGLDLIGFAIKFATSYYNPLLHIAPKTCTRKTFYLK